MHDRILNVVCLIVLCGVSCGECPAAEDDAAKTAEAEKTLTWQDARNAVARGLDFLQNDTAKWRQEHECATCHHGAMTVWVYSEARNQGYEVEEAAVTETVTWTRDRFFKRIDEPRDPRPGWKMVSTPALYLAVMAWCVPGQDLISADDRQRIAGHLIRHQETDGEWAWSSAPPINRPPPVFESDEVATRLAYIALNPDRAANEPQEPAVRDSRKNATAWLTKTEPANTTQAAALRLLMKVFDGESRENVEAEVARFLKLRNDDGGWGQLDDLPSDAYATGQAMYVLNLAGITSRQEQIQRAITFLVGTQRDDGSWPMKSRAHPGATPYRNPVPITCFGSAWATLGLMRFVPSAAPDSEPHRAIVEVAGSENPQPDHWTKSLKTRANRGTLHVRFQYVRGDTGKWNDEAQLIHAPPVEQKPDKVSLDDWFDQLPEKKFQITGNDENWLLFRTRQLDDNDRVWVERIERRGSEFTIILSEAIWQGKYSKTFTFYSTFGVNLGKLKPGKYEAKLVIRPLKFQQFEGSGQPRDRLPESYWTRENWPKDDRPAKKKPVELPVTFVVSAETP